LDVKRTDFKLDMVPAHLFMNLRVVDEHGRQLGTGRNLGALKAELGAQARGAFQALAAIKTRLPQAPGPSDLSGASGESGAGAGGRDAEAGAESATRSGAPGRAGGPQGGGGAVPPGRGAVAVVKAPKAAPVPDAAQRHTAWTFGALPELLEVRKGGLSLIGFPALVDQGDAVTLEVFDEPELAAAKHRAGLRRLFALQIKDALKYLEKNIPDLQKMAVGFMALGTLEDLRAQIIDVALDRAFLQAPLPGDEADFKRRVEEGRGRLTLIANEVARLAGVILADYAIALRKIKDTKNAPEATQDATQQLQRLVGKRFLLDTPWASLQHFPRYLKAVTLRLDKWRADPARDASRLAEMRPQEQRYWRLVAERKGVADARMLEFRWLLEELRVSFFAQELRTPQPVSLKRLDKAWQQLNS